ncbi:hypothetical protein LWP59_06170 [Amycolatopsis acidiphila]|uniref:Uncharacterized protein n=1 Tax=Amycolatopsis acidiphila TaxID=715473 RepID=A0A557ZWE2_9PSEU|nr:hypothetical protein [Amycolatopsis acidiphila]TVT16336.1 hypothetical protein FNH06_34815 [Amycolatopsis acidiphila]UIJ61220.1 hypothetical protein LWP59_06170 [Amycolatopsis acidiphila]GHG97732.1 hypothetical protein GCM10017788_77380 [Amycolatopsis acidiphila]
MRDLTGAAGPKRSGACSPRTARIACVRRLPVPPGPLRAAFARLAGDKLADIVTLRPLDPGEIRTC